MYVSSVMRPLDRAHWRVLERVQFSQSFPERTSPWPCATLSSFHRQHPRNGTIPEPASGQIPEQSHDSGEVLRVPTIVEAVSRSDPRGRIVFADDLGGDAGGLTHLTGREVAANTGQHDRLSIGILRGLHLPVRVLGHDPERDPALRAEAANLLEVQVVQLFEEPCSLALRELRQEIRHR